MCRLFGLSGAPNRVRATFWLLDASDSLSMQSRREPDGTGLGTFDPDGTPHVDKRPIAAYEDAQFACEAKQVVSTTFLAHIRYASTGGLDIRNTHPFAQHGRLLAHNGIISDLDRLEAELGDYRALVRGDTDSERFFALVTKHIDESGGDISAGITAAARWVAANLPLYALNLILTTPDELWALRYPDTHDLLVLERRPGGPSGCRHLEHASAAGTVRVRCGDLLGQPTVVIASERMDEDPGWRPLQPGELLHVRPDLRTESTLIIDRPPSHPIALAELGARAAASQAPVTGRGAT
ncbi:class II glutamine amidotransferase [Actinomadura scrupuli]|uniref:class II glutamine amidotransferase n=1 Tax=Actinomadura scrupuli TaxID=559629 RepID=UPI003D99AEC7